MKHLKFYPVLMLLFCIAFSGCISEITPPDPVVGDDEVLITIRVPGHSSGNNTTRSIPQESAEDNRVDRVDILLFDNAGAKLYLGRVWSTAITSGPGNAGNNTKTFRVRVPRRDAGTYDMLVLANAQAIIDAATLTVGTTTLAQVENGLLYTTVASGASGGWNALPGSGGYRPFPMWSKVENFNPSTSGGTLTNIELVRMLAKINVSFESAAVAARLQIDQITLVNYNTRGLLTSRHWNDAPRAPDPAADTHLAPGLANGINYTVSAVDRANWAHLVRDRIFLFERARPANATERQNSVALIIRGIYAGDTTPTYYRIDMVNSTTGVYYNIIRNHVYNVVITGINGRGMASAQLAFESAPFNITTAIDAWNEDGMNIHTYDGRYQITVDYDSFIVPAVPVAQPLRIYTDFPGIWTTEIPAAHNWITVTPGTGPAMSTQTVQVNTTGVFGGTTNREGHFYIVSGNLRKRITVIAQPASLPTPIVTTVGTGVGTPAAFCNQVTFRVARPLTGWTDTQWESLTAANLTVTLAGTVIEAPTRPLTFVAPYYYFTIAATATTAQPILINFTGSVGGYNIIPFATAQGGVTVQNVAQPAASSVAGQNCFNVAFNTPHVASDFSSPVTYTLNLGGVPTTATISWNISVVGGGTLNFGDIIHNVAAPANSLTAVLTLNPQLSSNALYAAQIAAQSAVITVSATMTWTVANCEMTRTVSRVVTIGNVPCCVPIGTGAQFACWAFYNLASRNTFVDEIHYRGAFFQWNSPTAWSHADPRQRNDATTGWVWTTSATNVAWANTQNTGTTWNTAWEPCPVGWVTPTQAQLNGLNAAPSVWINAAQSTALGLGGQVGRIYGPGANIATFDSSTQIFLPAAGQRSNTGTLGNVGTNGLFWSSTPSGTTAMALWFSSGGTSVNASFRASAFSVRCVAEE